MIGDHRHIGGLDLSTRNIGYAAPNGSMHSISAEKMPPHPRPFDLARRCNELRSRLARTIRLNPPLPTFIVIEGPFSFHAKTSARLDELRGVIRDLLFSWPEPHGSIEFVEIAPATLKLFSCGRGDADKTLMSHAATCRITAVNPFGQVPANDDEADAWHLRHLGRVAHGVDSSVAEYQVDALNACGVVF